MPIAVSEDGEYLAVPWLDGFLQVWKVDEMNSAGEQGYHTIPQTLTSLSRDGFFLASRSSSGTVPILDLTTGTQVFELPKKPEPRAIAFSEDHRFLAIGFEEHESMLHDFSTQEERTLRDLLGPTIFQFSKDSRFLAVVHSPKKDVVNISICDLTTSNTRLLETIRNEFISGVAFSEDNELLAVARERSVELWAVANTEVLWQQDYRAYATPILLGLQTEIVLKKKHDILTLVVNHSCGVTDLWGFARDMQVKKLERISLWFGPGAGGDGFNVITKRGLFQIPWSWHIMQSPGQEMVSMCKLAYLGTNWVCRNGEKLLWVPPDCRPSTIYRHPAYDGLYNDMFTLNMSFGNNTFAWRSANNQVIVIGFERP